MSSLFSDSQPLPLSPSRSRPRVRTAATLSAAGDAGVSAVSRSNSANDIRRDESPEMSSGVALLSCAIFAAPMIAALAFYYYFNYK